MRQNRLYSIIKTLSILLLIITGTIVSNSELLFSAENPRAVIRPARWDFGYLPQKSEVNHSFYLHNHGTTPLLVSKIKAGCSCTNTSKIEAPILPGDSAEIEITFKSGRFQKNISKSTKVFTNDSLNPVLKINISAYVYKRDDPLDFLSCKPDKISLEIVAKDSIHTIDSLKLTNNSSSTIELQALHTSTAIKWIELPEEVAPNDQSRILFERLTTLQSEQIKGHSITLDFIDQDTTRLTIPIKIKK